jgi:CheY-like chemotaxis protein
VLRGDGRAFDQASRSWIAHGKKHILLVEDEEDILALMHYNLMREGFRVSLAMTGEEGLAAIREDPPDLVVLDLMLPNMDGLEVCRAIKSTPEYRNHGGGDGHRPGRRGGCGGRTGIGRR